MNFSDRLEKFIQYTQKSINSFTTDLQFANGTISKAIRNNTILSGEKIEKICSKYPELNLNWLFTGEGEMILDERVPKNFIEKQKEAEKSMPIVVTVDSQGNNNIVQIDAKAAAGFPANVDNPAYFEKLPAFTLPQVNYQNGDYVCIQITGDSMHPTLFHQDWVIAKRIYDLTEIREGYIHILATRDGVVAKRLLNRVQERGKIVCKSDNTTYPVYEEEVQDVIAVYKVEARLTFNLRNLNSQLEMRDNIDKLNERVAMMESLINKLKD